MLPTSPRAPTSPLPAPGDVRRFPSPLPSPAPPLGTRVDPSREQPGPRRVPVPGAGGTREVLMLPLGPRPAAAPALRNSFHLSPGRRAECSLGEKLARVGNGSLNPIRINAPAMGANLHPTNRARRLHGARLRLGCPGAGDTGAGVLELGTPLPPESPQRGAVGVRSTQGGCPGLRGTGRSRAPRLSPLRASRVGKCRCRFKDGGWRPL